MNETMFSTLGAAPAETQQIYSVEIKGITFEKAKDGNEDPCRPRYKGFYKGHNPKLPDVQIEPAFQVDNGVGQINFILSLASSEVELIDDPDPGKPGRYPLCRVLGKPNLRPDIVYSGTSTCTLTWKRQRNVSVTSLPDLLQAEEGGIHPRAQALRRDFPGGHDLADREYEKRHQTTASE